MHSTRDTTIAFLACAAFAAIVMSTLQQARAQASVALQVAQAAHDGATAVGPGEVDSFTIACPAAAGGIAIKPSTGATMVSYTCQNTSTTKVAVGDNDIGDPTDDADAPQYCATNCPSQEWGGDVKQEFCRSDTGTVTIKCRAMVAAAP